MKADSFAEQYKHPKWQKLRLQVFKRDNFKCNLCTDGENQLHAHHINYKPGKKCWEYPASDLVTLCDECHKCVGIMIRLLRKSMVCRYEFSLLYHVLDIIIEHPTKECAIAIELLSENPSRAAEVVALLSAK
jgi:hypothetical protein